MGRIFCPDFIGRVLELEALDAALARARSGGAPTVLVGGEAGIGKSRLVGEFSRRVESEALVLSGACAPFGSSPPPFTPVVEALRASVRNADQARRARLSAKAPALMRLLPELDPEGSAAHRRESSETGQSLIFGELLAVLEDLATDRPMVLVLEDLHWADRSTLDLLALRSQTARAAQSLVVATYRSDELDPGHPLRLTLAELRRSDRTDRVELPRFGRNELIAQLTGILGHPPEYVVVEEILARSDGNPFLAEELLAGASEAPGRTPTNVRDIIMARVETLSEPTQRMLGVLSAAPRSMTHHDLAGVADMTEGDLERALREALARHVLVRTHEATYAFRHALMREAMYDALLVGERRRLHLRLARALDAAQSSAGDTPSQLLADRAHHWYHAGDKRRALQAAVEAGVAAEDVYAHAEALTQYERALELWDFVEDPEQLANSDLVALRARAAEAANALGEPLRAAHMIERALEDLDMTADPVRAGLLRERLGRYAWIGGDAAYALAAYEEAVRVIPSVPASAERARALAACAHAQFITNRDRTARKLAADGLAVARAVGAQTEEGRALATLGATVAALEDRRAGLAMLRDGRALLERAQASPDLVFVTYSYECDTLVDAGEFAAAVDAMRPGIELMRRQGMHRSHQSWLESVQAEALVKLGHWTEATDLMDATLARGPVGITRRWVQLLRAEVQLGRGEIATAAETMADARRAADGDHPFAGKLFELTAWLTAGQRDFAGARLAVVRGLAALEGHDDRVASAWLCWRGLQVEAERAEHARAHRRVAEAAAAAQVGEGLLGRVHALGAPSDTPAPAELPALKRSCAAELDRAAGRGTTESWLEAAAAWESLHEPYPRACCLARAVEAALTERRAKPQIAAWLAAAHEIATELGAAPLVQGLEARALRGRLPTQRQAVEVEAPAPPAPLGLTPREIDVLRLVGQGYTNARIADTLFISRKTAAAHVSNILGKLEVARRAEAAAIAARLGLLDEPTSERTT